MSPAVVLPSSSATYQKINLMIISTEKQFTVQNTTAQNTGYFNAFMCIFLPAIQT